MPRNTPKSQNGLSGLGPLFSFIGLMGTMIFFVIFSKIRKLDEIPISLTVIPLILGLTFEYRRICKNWKTIIYTTLGAFALSLFSLLPGKRERNYRFEEHLAVWPYYFIVVYCLIAIVSHSKKTTPQLTEGITLLQSIALIYWFIDLNFMNDEQGFLTIFFLLSIPFIAYSFFHALSQSILTDSARFILSLWSSVVMLVFSIDNILRVMNQDFISEDGSYQIITSVSLQYFVLGISSIYIVRNILMLSGFFPSRNRFFNKTYFNDINELRDEHISRYSAKQVKMYHTLIIILFTVSTFVANYNYHFLPRHTVVWLSFILSPYLLYFFDVIILNTFLRPRL